MFTRFVLLFTLIAAVCSAGNIVLNPSFEDGSNNWTVSNFNVTGGWFQTGANSIVTGCVSQASCMDPVSGAYFKQSLTTVPGQNYTLTFWMTENGGPNSEMAIYWNGALVQDINNPNNNGGQTGWLQFTFTNLLATSTSTVLQINGRQEPAGIFFDDLYVDVSGAAVPEPATFGICGLGLILLAIRLRRR